MAIGPVRPHVRRFADFIIKDLNFRESNIGGYATSGHIPNSDHYIGLALDFMTYSNKSLGEKVKDLAIVYAKQYNVKYIIWNRTIWEHNENSENPLPFDMSTYTGSSPHTEHVHVSFYPSDPGKNATPFETPKPAIESAWDAATKFISENALTVGMFVAGLVLIVAGLWLYGGNLL